VKIWTFVRDTHRQLLARSTAARACSRRWSLSRSSQALAPSIRIIESWL